MKNIFLILPFIFQLTGCASYQWGPGDKKLPGGYTQVSVPLFVNLTQEVGAEVPFTRAIVKEVERSQFASLVKPSDSEVTVRGTIQMLDFQGFSVIDIDDGDGERVRKLNTAYQIHATVLIELIKPSDGTVVWSTTVDGTRGYNGPKLTQQSVRSANPLYNKSAREQNLIIIANELMNEAFDKMTERF